MSLKIEALADGYKGDVTVLIMNVNRGITNKGAAYLSFTLQDNTGSIEAKYWNVEEHLLQQYKPGMLIKVHGEVLVHQHQLQFRINKIEEVSEELDIKNFVKEGPVKKEDLIKNINAYVKNIKNLKINTVVSALMKDYEKDFFEFPAAKKNHHDFYGGLATHVLGMLHLAHQMCQLYPLLNEDVLIAGVILHDLGKLMELTGAVVTEYTVEGKLLGHISIMQANLAQKAKELGIDGEEMTLLRHMILSHHGVYAYGSPVLPMIPEAEMLYFIDNIDARMNSIDKALKPCARGEFSSRIFALENRSFYKSKVIK